MTQNQNIAESIALTCLDWLLGQDELWPVFLGSTGADEADLKGRIEDPDLLGAVLDFILLDDEWVRRCCQEKSLAPEEPMNARAALPGGGVMNWT